MAINMALWQKTAFGLGRPHFFSATDANMLAKVQALGLIVGRRWLPLTGLGRRLANAPAVGEVEVAQRTR